MSGQEAWMQTLQDMGFPPNRSKRALKATDFKGVEPAMEWLLANADNPSLDDPVSEDEEIPVTVTEDDKPPEEPKKPLTEEERRERLEKLEELRKVKRAEREEREKKEALEKEKKRIEDGKGMTEIRQKVEEQEIKKMAELKRREKQEEREAKARVLRQIEEDKIARRQKFNMKSPDGVSSATAGPSTTPAAAAQSASPSAPPAAKRDYTETRIQIRQTNGQPIIQTFGVKEQLAAVRLYAQMNRTDGQSAPFNFMTNFPKKVFTDEDYENSLENLGLVPSAVLMMTK
eukprot:TRINITY_DN8203_c0_g1_i1.p1 TRINITY_DN8203_c0_g1~~TRINITY_DN8203_c0_g1_i1.p1  ORF type:complete len:288 (+),score=87.22 TRINITY_DN8203_c0_g1_i1:49-912(+)